MPDHHPPSPPLPPPPPPPRAPALRALRTCPPAALAAGPAAALPVLVARLAEALRAERDAARRVLVLAGPERAAREFARALARARDEVAVTHVPPAAHHARTSTASGAGRGSGEGGGNGGGGTTTTSTTTATTTTTSAADAACLVLARARRPGIFVASAAAWRVHGAALREALERGGVDAWDFVFLLGPDALDAQLQARMPETQSSESFTDNRGRRNRGCNGTRSKAPTCSASSWVALVDTDVPDARHNINYSSWAWHNHESVVSIIQESLVSPRSNPETRPRPLASNIGALVLDATADAGGLSDESEPSAVQYDTTVRDEPPTDILLQNLATIPMDASIQLPISFERQAEPLPMQKDISVTPIIDLEAPVSSSATTRNLCPLESSSNYSRNRNRGPDSEPSAVCRHLNRLKALETFARFKSVTLALDKLSETQRAAYNEYLQEGKSQEKAGKAHQALAMYCKCLDITDADFALHWRVIALALRIGLLKYDDFAVSPERWISEISREEDRAWTAASPSNMFSPSSGNHEIIVLD